MPEAFEEGGKHADFLGALALGGELVRGTHEGHDGKRRTETDRGRTWRFSAANIVVR